MKKKAEQGFRKLLISPLGMSLNDLAGKYKQTILKHHREGQLLAAKRDPDDPDEQLELDENQPLWVWEKYQQADTEGRLVYYPQAFDQDNHQGKTKQQIIQEQGAWNVLLIEDLPNIPRKGQGQTRGGRTQLEAGKTPREYLQTYQSDEPDSPYAHEQGFTPADHLTYAITHLAETNQVIDDYQGAGSTCYDLAGYFPASGGVLRTYWRRDYRRTRLDRDAPDARGGVNGSRAAVGVPPAR